MSKFIFIVQGDGRGHLTQAISLYEILTSAGHQVQSVLVGSANCRGIPAFFKDKINTELLAFESPTLVYGNSKSLRIIDTISKQIVRIKEYWSSTQYVHDTIKQHKPDVIINFYDMICGLYSLRFKPKIPIVCIGHQYLLLNQNFVDMPGHSFAQILLNLNTKITCIGATKLLGLAFSEIKSDQNVKVVPPLIRQEVKSLTTENEDFILAYTTHYRLAEDMMAWHNANPNTKIHCFWDNKEAPEVYQYSENLSFHRINSDIYLDMMRRCKGLVSTAGFESVCEAMYLGKPVMMVPVPNHIEQMINAFDGERAGAGMAATTFNFSPFLDYLPSYADKKHDFQYWQSKSADILLAELEQLASPQITFHFNAQKTQRWSLKGMFSKSRLSGGF